VPTSRIPPRRDNQEPDVPCPVPLSAEASRAWLGHLNQCLTRLASTLAFVQLRADCAPARTFFSSTRTDGDPGISFAYMRAVIGIALVDQDGSGAVGAVVDAAGWVHRASDVPPQLHERVDDALVQAGVSTHASCRMNVYLRLACSHMLLAPEVIQRAQDFPEPFPWPWYMRAIVREGRVDADGLRPQADPGIHSALAKPFMRIHQILTTPHHPGLRAEWGSSDEAIKSRQEKTNKRLARLWPFQAA